MFFLLKIGMLQCHVRGSKFSLGVVSNPATTKTDEPMQKGPWLLSVFFRGWNTTQLYWDCFKIHENQDANVTTSISWKP